MSIICDKGAIRNALANVENLPIEYALYEVIDNREHSKSNKFFIDINSHNTTCVIGFSESATEEQIDSMVKWYNVKDTHYNSNNIASRAAGKKYFDFALRGEYTHIGKHSDDSYYISSINTSKIYAAEIDPNISNKDFSETLSKATNLVKEESELVPSLHNIFENSEQYYPFTPKTVISAKKIDKNNDILNYFKETCNQDKIIKNLRIKYYNEIYYNNFELYCKFPNMNSFYKINTHEAIDVIGITNNFIDKYNINIYINTQEHLGYIFEIDNNFYKFEKNGNSVLRKKMGKMDIVSNLTTPDFTYVQYNINELTKEQKEASIVGSSLEHYAGLYINIGGVFISSDPVTWGINDKRNLPGAKNYRGILYINTNKAKSDVGLSGLKAHFNLANKPFLDKTIKSLSDIYKKYCKFNKPENPDDYVLVKSTAQKTKQEKKLCGYIYIIKLGPSFYKFGYTEKSDSKRFDSYKSPKHKNDAKCEFTDEIIYDTPILCFNMLDPIDNVRALEQNIKCIINDSHYCQTYDTVQGDDIREYFHCEEEHFYSIWLEIEKECIRFIQS
jgi:hypothetical protein